MMKGKLALDLGANLGYCIMKPDGSYISGSEKIKKKKGENKKSKYFNFKKWLETVIEEFDIGKIFYERVDFSINTYASQAHGAYVSTIYTLVTELNEDLDEPIQIYAYGVGHVKKALTGHGNATKMGMIHYASKWMKKEITNDNEADAVGVMVAAIKHGK